MIQWRKRRTLSAGRPAVASLDSSGRGVRFGFVHDAVDCGRANRVVSVLDAYTRNVWLWTVDTSLASRR
jgi:hypothetical protein